MKFLFIICLITLYKDVCSEGNLTQKSIVKNMVKQDLPIPDGYKTWEVPYYNKTTPVFARVSIFIRKILEINEKEGKLLLDADIGLGWVDWNLVQNFRISNNSDNSTKYGIEQKTVDASFLEKIWKPDIYFDKMASVEKPILTSELTTLHFHGGAYSGAFDYNSRSTISLRCDMSFEYYPADTQTCEYYVRSYSHNASTFVLFWNTGYDILPTHGIYLNDLTDPNFDLQISSVNPVHPGYGELFVEENFDFSRRGNYTALSFTIKARRKLSYHMVQTYLPSVLLILITWLCFLLPADMVEARIGISMTTLLTLTAMFGSAREQSPEVSYTMAIDVWMVFCIGLIFIALFLFTIIHWMTRRIKQKEAKKTDSESQSSISSSTVTSFYKIRDIVKRYAFHTFAVIFFSFITLYWVILFYYSEYFSWNPDPWFNNAIHEEEKKGNLSYGYRFYSSNESLALMRLAKGY